MNQSTPYTTQSGSVYSSAVKLGAIFTCVAIFAGFLIQIDSICQLEYKDRISILLAMLSPLAIVPWLFGRIATSEFASKSIKSNISFDALLKGQAEALEGSIARIEDMLPSEIGNRLQIQETLNELKEQVGELHNFRDEFNALQEATNFLKNQRHQKRIAREATSYVFSTLKLDDYTSTYPSRDLKQSFSFNISQCLRWLSYSLEGGVAADAKQLKTTFVIRSIVPYEEALIFIKERKVAELFSKKDVKVQNKIKEYIDILIERLKEL